MADERMQNNEPDVNQLRKVRREKLRNLQAEGKDPFTITVFDQKHHTEQAKAMAFRTEPSGARRNSSPQMTERAHIC